MAVVLLLADLGALLTWPHSRGWGDYPSGGLGISGSNCRNLIIPWTPLTLIDSLRDGMPKGMLHALQNNEQNIDLMFAPYGLLAPAGH